MIEQVIAAPKHLDVDTGVSFAVTHRLGYEIPGFVEPEILENWASHVPGWKSRLGDIAGPLGLHGPVYDLNPVSWDPEIAEISQKRYRQATLAAQALNCQFLVVHSQYSSILSAANIQQEWLASSIDFWREFAETHLQPSLSNIPLTIVLENFMEPEPELLGSLVEGINHPQIKACLDTGHANIYANVPLTAWVDTLGSHLTYIHAHNNQGQWDEHRGFNNGQLDMEVFLAHLANTPHPVNLALEVFNLPELEDSLAMTIPYLSKQSASIPVNHSI